MEEEDKYYCYVKNWDTVVLTKKLRSAESVPPEEVFVGNFHMDEADIVIRSRQWLAIVVDREKAAVLPHTFVSFPTLEAFRFAILGSEIISGLTQNSFLLLSVKPV